MNRFPLLRWILTGSGSALMLTTALMAQSYEDQARSILKLYESGQKDSAYTMIEPLKRSARFVPAVIFTRAQMTPDDRALGLLKEIVALEPGGAWADEAVYQLVRRYADKRDSLAAHTWMGALRLNYPRSPFIPAAEDVLRNTSGWMTIEPDAPERTATASEPPKPTTVSSEPKRTTATSEPKRSTTTPAAATTETYRASGMRGFALQVGLFPTRKAAEDKAAALKKKNVRALPLPKTVDGKKQYALVVGPYKSIDEANRKKGTIATACDCAAFVVKVE